MATEHVVEDDALPFADCELIDEKKSEKNTPISVHPTKVTEKKRKPKNEEEKLIVDRSLSKCYFENAAKEANLLSLIPYSGPCNTHHLDRQLFIAQIESKENAKTESSDELEKFFSNYRYAIELTKTLPNDIIVRAFMRVGISYVIKGESLISDTLTIQEFLYHRTRGKSIKTAFYTCKGVTSPKRLITSLHKENYRHIVSNNFSYDIQLHVDKNRSNIILHFQLDEQCRCRNVSYHPSFPSSFDFIRDKSSSRFRSLDDSYADMFDFRLQLTYTKYLSKTDPIVTKILQDVSIDEILYVDKKNEVLRIAPKLRRFVKYLRCVRSNQYQNDDEQILISIGSYEEYRWDNQGLCQSLMKAENTMTIELLDQNKIKSPQKMYDVGLWFSNLCQNSVDLSLKTVTNKNQRRTVRWFSKMAIFARKYNKTTKQMNVRQLTTYKSIENNRTYTSEDMSWVRNILREEDLKTFFTNADGKMLTNRNEIDQKFNTFTQRLEPIGTSSSRKALKKVVRGYHLVCHEIDAKSSSK